MKFASILTASALAVTAIASPTTHLTIHEKRDAAPIGWAKRGLLPRDAVLPMSIAVKQGNLDKAYEHLMDVSHPSSENFGKHWTAKQVAEAFRPRYGQRSASFAFPC